MLSRPKEVFEVSDDRQLLNAAQVAEMLQVPIATLYAWRYRGFGPKAIKVGRHLRWRRRDLDAWLDEQQRPP